MRRLLLAFILLALTAPNRAAAQVVTAWDDGIDGDAAVSLLRSRKPGSSTPPTPFSGASLVLANGFRGQVLALSRITGRLTVLDRRTRRVRRTIELGAAMQPEDVAATAPCRAYVSGRAGGVLLRVDLCAGTSAPATDLSGYADADGNPDLGMIITHRGRLFVQVRRINEDVTERYVRPAMLAVVDLASETLIDADPARDGIQAIELAGTAAKHRMQLMPDGRTLYVGATGGVADDGGIEAIDLDALRSDGLVIRESDGLTGADIGPFVFTTAEAGYLAFTTDFDLSSHLVPFSIVTGPQPIPGLYTTVGYAMPALAHDPRAGVLFAPDGAFEREGIYAFDAVTGQRVGDRVATTGHPSDLLLLGPVR